MNTGVISSRYAKALLDYAVSLDDDDATYDNMLQLLAALQSVREFSQALGNPYLSQKKRADLICAAVVPSKSFKAFAELVVKQGREDMLLFMAHAYIMLYRKRKGIYAARFITATPADDSFRQEITCVIEDKVNAKVELECLTDELIIGGFILETDSRRLDASIKGEIGRIRNVLVKQKRKLV